ncbi:MAG TPA: mechanosensitive ion channel protein MscS, partial [Alphaproteobacteria bacterium]|nr:mechanosensitive ion channel protein MscS [Alphaproteobacteria bacterium]
MHGASPSFPAIRLAVVVLALLFSVAAGSPAAGQLTDTGVPEEGLSPERAKALADLLGDDKARQAIIQELQGIAEQTQAESPAPAAEQAPQDESFVRSIAETTQSFAEGFAGRMLLFWEQLKNAPRALKAIQGVSPEIVIDAVADLLLLMVTTIVLFLVLRWAAKRLYWTMGEAAQQAGAFRTGLIFGASVLIDAGVVIIAWAAGYLLTLLVFGDLGDVGIRQTLYLNAFLTVEMVKVIIRALLSPASADLRLIALPDKGARTLSRWLNVSVSLIGYGQMLVVPIVNQNVSFFAGRAVSTILSLLTVAILIGLVLAHRRAVSHWLRGERRLEHRSAVSRFLARYWHVPVVLYLVSLFAIVLARPGGILLPLLIISGQVLAAGVIGMVVANFLKRAMSR